MSDQTPEPEWVVVDHGRQDYYEGSLMSVHHNGVELWRGYSCDCLPEIVDAIVGRDVPVRQAEDFRL